MLHEIDEMLNEIMYRNPVGRALSFVGAPVLLGLLAQDGLRIEAAIGVLLYAYACWEYITWRDPREEEPK